MIKTLRQIVILLIGLLEWHINHRLIRKLYNQSYSEMDFTNLQRILYLTNSRIAHSFVINWAYIQSIIPSWKSALVWKYHQLSFQRPPKYLYHSFLHVSQGSWNYSSFTWLFLMVFQAYFMYGRIFDLRIIRKIFAWSISFLFEVKIKSQWFSYYSDIYSFARAHKLLRVCVYTFSR